jgi:hypothetical protein
VDSKEIIETFKRLDPSGARNFHIEVLANVVDKLDTLNNKFDKYENITLLDGDNDEEPFIISRPLYLQRMYNSSKTTIQLKKDFEDHVKHTFQKGITKFGTFVNNVVIPVALLVSLLLGIYSFINNRSDFHRSDNLQKEIQNMEKQTK